MANPAYSVDNLKEYAPYGELRTGGRLARRQDGGDFLEAKVGTVVVQVDASGLGTFVPAEYKIIAGNELGAFTVADDGTVSVADPTPLNADDEAVNPITLNVTAYDANGASSSPDAVVTITLVGVSQRPVLDPAFAEGHGKVDESSFSVAIVNHGDLPTSSLKCTTTNTKFVVELSADGKFCDVTTLVEIDDTHDMVRRL